MVLAVCVAYRRLYDRYGVGHGGWKLNLTIGTLAVFIAAVAVSSGRVLRRSRETRAVVLVVLLPGLWLGALTSPPIRAALTAASGSASQPLSDGQSSAAASQLATQMRAPSGWTRSARSCTQGYVCWSSPQLAFFTKSSYVALAKQFGVRLNSANCDEPLGFVNGRGAQNCDGVGLNARYQVAILLEIRRGLPALSGTQILIAPLRRLS